MKASVTAGVHGLSLEGGPVAAALRRRIPFVRNHPLGTVRRAVLVGLICWVPLALLAAMEREAVRESFVHDLSTHARMLLSVPMFILLDRWVGDFVKDSSQRMYLVTKQEDRRRCRQISMQCQRAMTAPTAEAAILVLTYFAIVVRAIERIGSFRGWEFHGKGFSPAAVYFLAVSLPAFYFFGLRWIWRYAVWVVFLARCSVLRLKLIAAYPDGAGTLSFVGRVQVWFSLVAVAAEWAITARWAETILWEGARVQQFTMIASVTVGVVAIFFAFPVLFFSPHLWRLRFRGLRRFDHLVVKVSDTFEELWVPYGDSKKFLEESPSSPLTDIHSVREAAHKLKLTPLSARRLGQICLSAMVPMLLPAVVNIPLPELLKHLFQAVV